MNFLKDVLNRFETGSQRSGWHEQAWTEFRRLGLPDRKNDEWKYSPISGLTQTSWSVPPVANALPARVREWRDRLVSDFDVLVVVNGQFLRSECRLSTDLEKALRNPSLESDSYDDGFTSLSAALATLGVCIELGRGQRLARPVAIVRAVDGTRVWGASADQIRLGEGAELQLAEVFLGGDTGLCTHVSRYELGDGARLDLLRVQSETNQATHFSDTRVTLAAKAQLHLTQLNCGAMWARTVLAADLVGEGSEAHINGLTITAPKAHMDTRTIVRHHCGQTVSGQLFKGVLREQSRGILNGKIFIARDAQKVNSSQYNHSLLLGSGAEADTKPELEIYADDVKANHGASIGRLDDDKIFYLLSRGIRRDQAERILSQAFVRDVVMKVASRRLRALAETIVEQQGLS